MFCFRRKVYEKNLSSLLVRLHNCWNNTHSRQLPYLVQKQKSALYSRSLMSKRNEGGTPTFKDGRMSQRCWEPLFCSTISTLGQSPQMRVLSDSLSSAVRKEWSEGSGDSQRHSRDSNSASKRRKLHDREVLPLGEEMDISDLDMNEQVHTVESCKEMADTKENDNERWSKQQPVVEKEKMRLEIEGVEEARGTEGNTALKKRPAHHNDDGGEDFRAAAVLLLARHALVSPIIRNLYSLFSFLLVIMPIA